MKLSYDIKASPDKVTTGLIARPARGGKTRQRVAVELWLSIGSPS